MAGKSIIINAHDGGNFSAYLATPKSGSGPGIVVIQEIFGVNQGMRQICDAYADQGYFALCPDIFWRQQPDIQLTDQTEAEWKRAFELYTGFDVTKGIEDLKSTLACARNLPGSTGRAGVTGYCLGGLLTYLMACRSDSDASAAYYGGSIHQHLSEAGMIKNPTMLHFAEKDEYIDKKAQKSIREALSDHPLIEMYFYPGVNHAFARPNGQHFDAKAAEGANQRTAAFLANHLK